ncbi:cytoplasmic dynein 2 intermediate chain 1 isoform X2 [Prorops nasuta]|uniref:cytoplasmic dynein 2 intermediate chain 1 isoform X2 n=1 Tax=Prorops nasuta TaxID=863751 RepID=UPI0034CD2F6D
MSRKQGAVRKEYKLHPDVNKKDVVSSKRKSDYSLSSSQVDNIEIGDGRKHSIIRRNTYSKSVNNENFQGANVSISTSLQQKGLSLEGNRKVVSSHDLKKSSIENTDTALKSTRAKVDFSKAKRSDDTGSMKNLDLRNISQKAKKNSYLTASVKVKDSHRSTLKYIPGAMENKVVSEVVKKEYDKIKIKNIGKESFHIEDNTKNSNHTVNAINSHQENLDRKEYNSDIETDNEYTYEDDFEDYESDFQECTDSEASFISEESRDGEEIGLDDKKSYLPERSKQTQNRHHKPEEEHMLDSGHFELSEAWRTASKFSPRFTNFIVQNMNNIVNTRGEKLVENKSLPLSMDEGFEDSRSGEFDKSYIELQKRKSTITKKKRNRGKELLEMIKLDIMTWSLFECAPIPYDEFIRNYGKLNSRQVSTETRADNLDIEAQTDDIEYTNKWTQFPVTCRNILQTTEDIDLFRMEHIGVGGDDVLRSDRKVSMSSFPSVRLSEFLNRASIIILSILSKNSLTRKIRKSDKHEIPFSEGYCDLSMNSIPYLSDRKVLLMQYASGTSEVLLTIHSPADEEIEMCGRKNDILDCCVGCIWNVWQSTAPLSIFYSPYLITDCMFYVRSSSIIIGGLEDGSICIWDLKENEIGNYKIRDAENNSEWLIRTVSFTTAGNIELGGHRSKIISLCTLSKDVDIENLSKVDNSKFTPTQICSLDEEGCIIIWSVLRNISFQNSSSYSSWSSIILVKSQQIDLSPYSKKINGKTSCFVSMYVDESNINNIYVATDSNYILNITHMTKKIRQLIYNDEESDVFTNVTCVERCPFEPSYFMVGSDNGTLRLHSLNMRKPLLQLKIKDRANKIIYLQWCKFNPFNIFALDNCSRLYMWDLKRSEIYPTYTTSTQEWGRVCCMKLSACQKERDSNSQYLTLGMASGNIRLYKLNHKRTVDEAQQDVSTSMHHITSL